MQDESDNQAAAYRNGQNHVPRQRLGEAMKQSHILCSVNIGLQSVDTFAEKQRSKARGNPDQQSDEPELYSVRSFMSQYSEPVPK